MCLVIKIDDNTDKMKYSIVKDEKMVLEDIMSRTEARIKA